MELLENYSHIYKYRIDKERKTYTMFDGARKIIDANSIYDNLFSFLNYDLKPIQSALDILYRLKETHFSIEKFRANFNIVEQELCNIFGDSIIDRSDSAFKLNNITIDFIIKDYTEYLKQDILKKQLESSHNVYLESVIKFIKDNSDDLKQILPQKVYSKINELPSSDPSSIKLIDEFHSDFINLIPINMIKDFNSKCFNRGFSNLIHPEEIQQIQDKYYRFFLCLCATALSLDSLTVEFINCSPLNDLKDKFYNYYCYIEYLFYQKIYPIFYSHAEFAHNISAATPPYILQYIKHQIIDALSSEIILREYIRLEKGDYQACLEKRELLEALNAKDFYSYNKYNYDFTTNNKHAGVPLIDYFNEICLRSPYDRTHKFSKDTPIKEFFEKYIIDSPNERMPRFYYPIKIYMDFWSPSLFKNLTAENPRRTYKTLKSEEQFIFNNIENSLIIHCYFFIQSGLYVFRCANTKCHKIGYTNNSKQYCCSSQCTQEHRNEISQNMPYLNEYNSFRKRLASKISYLNRNKRDNSQYEELETIATKILEQHECHKLSYDRFEYGLLLLQKMYNNYRELEKLEKRDFIGNLASEIYENKQSLTDEISKNKESLSLFLSTEKIKIKTKKADSINSSKHHP